MDLGNRTENARDKRWAMARFELRGVDQVETCISIRPRATGEPEETPRPWKSVQGEERDALMPLYLAWKRNEEAPIDGTPLTMWPEMVKYPSILEALKRQSIRSVEDLASMPEGNAANIGAGTITLIEKARAWLTSANKIDKVLDENKRLVTENKALKDKLDFALARLSALDTPGSATLSPEEKAALTTRKKPGPKPKNQGDAGQPMTG